MPQSPRLVASRRLVVALTAASLSVVLSAAPASADDFAPTNTAPTVSSPTLVMPGTQTDFEPDAAESGENYTYAVTVSDAQSLNDLDRVDVCLYHSASEIGGAGEGDPGCGTINPQNTVKLTWTRSTNVFTISTGSSNNYWRLGAGANVPVAPSDLTATAGLFEFKFKVSEAMREGTWTAKITATDTSAATATDSTASKTVAAYSSITTRVQPNFGTLAVNTAATATTSPTVTSNGATTVSLTAGNFTSAGYTFTLKTDGATTAGPATGQVTFDCMTGGTFTEASATRVGTAATSLGAGTAIGTPENGSAVSNTCRLKHGGGRPVAAYSFTVVNAVNNA